MNYEFIQFEIVLKSSQGVLVEPDSLLEPALDMLRLTPP